MVRYAFADADLGEVRFGISPLCEAGLSLRAVQDPSRYPLQLPWLEATRVAREGVELDLLLALFNERGHSPDFLNPRPESPLTRIEDELRRLAQVPLGEFRARLESVHGAVPTVLAGRRAPQRVAGAVAAYWHACIAPHWPRMRGILQADIVYRGGLMTTRGTLAMLGGLAPTVEVAADHIRVRLRTPIHHVVSVSGAGLTLVPTMFTSRASVPLDPDQPPMIMYVARGQGAMWAETPYDDPALVELLGRTRADLLRALSEPTSSTHLATRLGVTPSAVTQHLRVMQRTGLLTSARHGRSVSTCAARSATRSCARHHRDVHIRGNRCVADAFALVAIGITGDWAEFGRAADSQTAQDSGACGSETQNSLPSTSRRVVQATPYSA